MSALHSTVPTLVTRYAQTHNAKARLGFMAVPTGSFSREWCEETHSIVYEARCGRLFWSTSRRLRIHFSTLPRVPHDYSQTSRHILAHAASTSYTPLTPRSCGDTVRFEGCAEGIWRYARGLGSQVPRDVWQTRRGQSRNNRRRRCRYGGRKMDREHACCGRRTFPHSKSTSDISC